MQDEQEAFAPRKNDRLVEPMFVGLGAGVESERDPDEETPSVEPETKGASSLLRRLLRRLLGRR